MFSGPRLRDPWRPAARRGNHIVELKTYAKEGRKKTHTMRRQKQTKITRTLEQQIDTPAYCPHTSAHA